jgi:hypothetical protein
VGQTPNEIRAEIEETRGRMTETVEGIAYRADVKSRARDAITAKKEAIVGAKDTVVSKGRGAAARLTAPLPGPGDAASAVSGAGSDVAGRVSDALPDRQQVREVVSVAQSNPVGLALGAAAVGFLVGIAVPTTSMEDEKLGPISDRLREQAADVGQQALEHGKAVAQDAAHAAGDVIQQQGQERADELADSLRESARSVVTED